MEDFLATMHSYFSSSPKHTLEFQKLVVYSKSKGNKILKNVEIRSISIFELVKGALKESIVKKYLSMLLDWQNMLPLPY